jgi:hypothetical protein
MHALQAALSPWVALAGLLLAVLIVVAPGAILGLLVRIYPPGNPRRRDLPNELGARTWSARPGFLIAHAALVVPAVGQAD